MKLFIFFLVCSPLEYCCYYLSLLLQLLKKMGERILWIHSIFNIFDNFVKERYQSNLFQGIKLLFDFQYVLHLIDYNRSTLGYAKDKMSWEFGLIETYHISSKKCPWHLINFPAFQCGAYWREKTSKFKYTNFKNFNNLLKKSR